MKKRRRLLKRGIVRVGGFDRLQDFQHQVSQLALFRRFFNDGANQRQREIQQKR